MVKRTVLQPETIMVPTTTLVPQTILRPTTIITREDRISAANFVSPVNGARFVPGNAARFPGQAEEDGTQRSLTGGDTRALGRRLSDLEKKVARIEQKLRGLCEE